MFSFKFPKLELLYSQKFSCMEHVESELENYF